MTPIQGIKPKSLDTIKTDKAERMRADKYSFAKIGMVLEVSGNTVSRALQARQTAYNNIYRDGNGTDELTLSGNRTVSKY